MAKSPGSSRTPAGVRPSRARPSNRAPGANRRPADSASPAGEPPRARLGAHRRRPWWTVAAVAVVIAIAATFALLSMTSSSKAAPKLSGTTDGGTPATAAVVAEATSVPAAVLARVGTPSNLTGPQPVKPASAPLLGAEGKPQILYVGADYCPYCAVQRWALVVALSHFGTFSGLAATESSTLDSYPGTKTFSFYGSTYSSPSIDFVSVELASNQPVNGRYPTLQKLTPGQRSVMDALDVAPYTTQPGAIPFIDFANRSVMIGGSFSPSVLSGLSMQQIADRLSQPDSDVARAVDGTANLFIREITALTGVQPSA